MEYLPEIIPREEEDEMLQSVHIALGNAKRLLLDIHHDVET
jgi:hypothetical protein